MKISSLTTILCLPLIIMSCLPKSGIGSNVSVKAGDIISALNDGKAVYFQDKTIEGDLDFTQLASNTESESMKRVQVPVSVTFIKCRFKGKVNAFVSDNKQTTVCTFRQNLTFTACEMEDDVSFREMVVMGKANFSSDIFHKQVTFEGARFASEAFFTKSNFQQEARFQNCFFGFKSNWMDIIFEKVVSFQNAYFSFDAQFSSIKFMDYADFSVCVYKGHVFFNYAKFYTQAIFNNSAFHGRFETISTEFGKNTEIKRSVFYGNVKFNQAKANGKMIFDNSTFLLGVPETTGWVKGENFSLSTSDAKFGSFGILKAEDLK